MSGFEVAGIALAVFPILVDGMVRFVDGVQTIRQWRRYRVRLQDYADFMGTQAVYYQDTLEELLTGIVQSEDEIVDLMRQPRGAIWKKPQYGEKLRRRLGRSHLVFQKMSDKMVKALLSICEKLGIDPSGELLQDDSSRLEREMKRIKVTLSKHLYKEILDTIDNANKELREITHQNIYLEPIRHKRRSRRPLLELKLIRRHATSLYQVLVLGRAWKCSCNLLHMASLRLESRPNELEATNPDTLPTVRFRILLSARQEEDSPWIPSQWQEVEIIPSIDKQIPNAITVGPPVFNRRVRFEPNIRSIATVHSSQEAAIDNDCELIADMCSTLCKSHEPKKVIGFLVDEEDDKHKHYLYRAHTTIGPETRSKSLCDLLSRSERGPQGALLSRNDRLRIAVTLASSVLQLDGTSWLQPQWSSKDICFHEKNSQASSPSYSYPYMCWKRCMTADIVPDSLDSLFRRSHVIRNEVLFALGLTLIELCFGNTIAEMHDPDDGDPNEADTEMRLAHRLCNSVYSEMGTSYGDVVRRCLYQPFDVRDMSLDNEELQQRVFDDIVTPLNDDLLNFNGKSRIR